MILDGMISLWSLKESPMLEITSKRYMCILEYDQTYLSDESSLKFEKNKPFYTRRNSLFIITHLHLI